jgi:zinc transporter ZupT
MLLPLTIAFVAVALGTALAILPREGARIVKPIRFIALIAALVVIATHLVPEALEELGPRALIAFAAGIVLPWVLESLGELAQRRAAGTRRKPLAALEISYVGLVVHRFGDGLSMGAIALSSHTPADALGVLLTLAAHIVPVTTVMVLAFVSFRGRGVALFRAAWLAAATMSGVVAATMALERGPKDVSPWVSALVAGLLLHLVAPSIPRRNKSAAPPTETEA